VSSGYSATFFAASKQRNSNSVQGIFMYEKFSSYALLLEKFTAANASYFHTLTNSCIFSKLNSLTQNNIYVTRFIMHMQTGIFCPEIKGIRIFSCNDREAALKLQELWTRRTAKY
jgi:hypothetical protein